MNRPAQGASCIPENLTLYHYGELPEAQRLRLEQHLQGCTVCRRELEQLRAALDLLPPSPEPTEEAVRSLQQRLRQRPGRPQPKLVLGWSLAASAALLLTLTLRPQMPAPVLSVPGEKEAILRLGGDPGRFPDTDLLLDLELLEEFELLQELKGLG